MENLYDDAGVGPGMETPSDAPMEESEEATAVLPRSFFEAAGKTPEPGTVCKVRVLAAHDESIEVAYERDDTEGEPEPDLESAPAMSEMAMMME
jgi:hypothetical protein